MADIKHIIVIGASAGGLKAITELVAGLPENIDAAVFVVLHMSENSLGEVITHRLQLNTRLVCRIPENEETIRKGYVYVAPPDYHLSLKKEKILITRGPHENRWRPSIDVLFRSAAAAFDSRVIGIVLSGLLDDGTAGMGAIKRSGGITIVQEPAEAEFDDMPRNVLQHVDVNYRISISDIPYVLQDLASKPPGPQKPVPEDVKIEAEITEKMNSSIKTLSELGKASPYVCPDCGGGLWEINQDYISRYRCHTGHVYTERLLLEKQSEVLEESLWVSMRMLEERRNLLLSVADHEQNSGDNEAAADKREKAADLAAHIERLKQLMISIGDLQNKSQKQK
jgi:two-component system, chemotaxis family, protein-glutamate methylesterase/glutaminase